ncbi:MAG: LamG domain-containing protein [Polyangiales bacterium]
MTLKKTIALIVCCTCSLGCGDGASRPTGGSGGAGGFGGGPTEAANVYSLLFDGMDDFGSAGDVSNTLGETIDAFSISLWFKAVGTPDTGSMMLQLNPELETGANSMQFSLFWASADEVGIRLTPDFTSGPTAEVSTEVSDPQAWNHVVVSFDSEAASDNVRLYLNGVDVGAGDLATPLDAVGNIQFGRQGAGVNHYGGFLDEAAIWGDVLSAEEVASVYNAGETRDVTSNYDNYTSSGDLQSLWRMGDENVGDEENVSDLISANHFTVVGGGTFETDIP